MTNILRWRRSPVRFLHVVTLGSLPSDLAFPSLGVQTRILGPYRSTRERSPLIRRRGLREALHCLGQFTFVTVYQNGV